MALTLGMKENGIGYVDGPEGGSTRIRAVNATTQMDAGQQYVTQQTLEKFGEKLMEKFHQKLKIGA